MLMASHEKLMALYARLQAEKAEREGRNLREITGLYRKAVEREQKRG